MTNTEAAQIWLAIWAFIVALLVLGILATVLWVRIDGIRRMRRARRPLGRILSVRRTKDGVTIRGVIDDPVVIGMIRDGDIDAVSTEWRTGR